MINRVIEFSAKNKAIVFLLTAVAALIKYLEAQTAAGQRLDQKKSVAQLPGGGSASAQERHQGEESEVK